MSNNNPVLESKRAKLMEDWKNQISSKPDIVFPDDGQSYKPADYFITDGPLDGFDAAQNRVVVLGREARGISTCDYPTIFQEADPAKINDNAHIFYRRALKIAEAVRTGKPSEKRADEIFNEYNKNKNYNLAIIEMSKYSNDQENGAKSNYDLQNRFFADSELDKRNFFREELELLNLNESDIIVGSNLFGGKIEKKYSDLMFGDKLVLVKSEPGLADYYTYEINGKKIPLVDVYHLSNVGNDNQMYVNPVLNAKNVFSKQKDEDSDFKGSESFTPRSKVTSSSVTQIMNQKNTPATKAGGVNRGSGFNWKLIIIIAAVVILALLSLLLFRGCSNKDAKAKKVKTPVVSTSSTTGNSDAVVEPVETTETTETTQTAEPVKQEVKFREITVQAGDSYYKIAERELGDRHLWPYLYSLNQSLHADPDLLEVGDRIVIPVIEDDVEDFVEENVDDVEVAYVDAYNSYNKVNKNYRAVRALASGEIIVEGFLDSIQTRIPAKDLGEARESVKRTISLDRTNNRL